GSSRLAFGSAFKQSPYCNMLACSKTASIAWTYYVPVLVSTLRRASPGMRDLATGVCMLNWQDTYRLSRFVLISTSDKRFVLECPLTNTRFPVAGASVFRILEALNRPRRLDALLDAVAEEQRAAVKSFIEACGNAGLLTRVGADGLAEEDT